MRVITAADMALCESRANDSGIDYYRMMENAGAAAVQQLTNRFSVKGKRVCVLCGKGNNGGDGLVAARLLKGAGARVWVVLTEGEVTTDAAKQARAALPEGTPVIKPADSGMYITAIEKADIVIDGVFGTGFRGELCQMYREMFAWINQLDAYLLSLDLPSGVEADTGRVAEDALKANLTVMFSTAKCAAMLRPGSGSCGKVAVCDIGIPDEISREHGREIGTADTDWVQSAIPPRAADSYKGQNGQLVSVCGSDKYRGAAVLSADTAMRSGTGYLTVASVPSVCERVSLQVPEAVLCKLPADDEGQIACAGMFATRKLLDDADALLLGCGLGRGDQQSALVHALTRQSPVPVLLDGDALFAVSQDLSVLRECEDAVLTPHYGEMARLTSCSVDEVAAHPIQTALAFAQVHRCTVVLKGLNTVIVSAEGEIFINPTGNAGLAKAGSGDALAGIIASLMAQKIPPFQAAVCGVWIHGRAADILCEEKSCRGLMPSDLSSGICRVLLELNR